MALYVAICLIGVLIAREDEIEQTHARVLGIIWGTAMGLALAHWFAFRLSARLVARGTVHRQDALIGLAQLRGAIGVALAATVPVILLPASAELDAVRLVLAALIAAVGYAVARSGGASGARSLLYAAAMLGLATLVAIAKNHLAGH